jgi:hypothetical protein
VLNLDRGKKEKEKRGKLVCVRMGVPLDMVERLRVLKRSPFGIVLTRFGVVKCDDLRGRTGLFPK